MGGCFHSGAASIFYIIKKGIEEMIEISAAVHQDKIIELLNNYNENGIQFTFKEKKGINLYFETTADDVEKASGLVKSVIKKQPWGSVLYFRASAI